jgi:hypothetical protein
MPRRSGTHPEIVTIYWRDIPAQVNGQAGRDRHQIMLSSKFQRAIDRAKRKANIYTADEDIAQWKRTSIPSAGELGEDAAAQAERIESAYPREHLGRLAYAGGFEADIEGGPVDGAELLALEELDEDEGEREP